MARRELDMPKIESALNGMLGRLVPTVSRELVRLWLGQAARMTSGELEAVASGKVPAALAKRLEADYRAWLERHLARHLRRAAESSSKQVRSGLAEIGVGLGAAVALAAIGTALAARMATRRKEWTQRQRLAWGEARRADGLSDETRRDLMRATVGLSPLQARGLRALAEQLERDERFTGRTRRAALERRAADYHRARGSRLGRTELVEAYSAGITETVRAAGEEGLVRQAFKRWRTQRDELVCRVCGPLHGVVRPIRDPFPGGRAAPPAHPNCRCTLDLLVVVQRRAS